MEAVLTCKQKEKKEQTILNDKFKKGKTSKINSNIAKKCISNKLSTCDSEDDDAQCLYCLEFFFKSVEERAACSQYQKWAHNSCYGIDSDDDETYLICDLFKN